MLRSLYTIYAYIKPKRQEKITLNVMWRSYGHNEEWEALKSKWFIHYFCIYYNQNVQKNYLNHTWEGLRRWRRQCLQTLQNKMGWRQRIDAKLLETLAFVRNGDGDKRGTKIA